MWFAIEFIYLHISLKIEEMKANLTLIVDSYWSSLSHLSNDVKLHLIAKLSESLIQTPVKKTTENLADRFYGAWDDSRTAEEIIEDIQNSRTFNRQIEIF